jgi:WD40 repeat protein/serine/threonine protein kinase
VEAYLKQHPTLQSDSACALELIYNEFLLREEIGETPRPEEYQQRFPQFAEELRRLFEVDRALDLEDCLPTVAAPPPGPGSQPTVAGYEILEELGRGGMGVVYKARQVKADRIVALKMLSAGARASADDLERFRQEAKKLARLPHPHIVPIYEVGEHDGLPFFSMEYVAGGSLAQKLQGNPFPADEAARLVETLARTLHFVHQNGLIHRDLKPGNVLLQIANCNLQIAKNPPAIDQAASCNLQAAIAKLSDFGLAKRLDPSEGQTPGFVLPGTPRYMAPEQARDQTDKIGVGSDVYGLGATLYELLTGRPPFGGATILETLEQVIGQDPVPPRRLQPRLPRDLETICLKCLEKEPARRYASALELAEDLRRYRAGEPIRARPASLWERAAKWARRRPALASLIGLGGAAALLLLAVTGLYTARLQAEVLNTKAARRQAEEGELKANRYWYAFDVNGAQQALERGYIRTALFRLDRQVPAPGKPDLRGPEWNYLKHLCRLDLYTRPLHTDDGQTAIATTSRQVAFSPDGRLLAAASVNQVRIWEATTGNEVRVLRGHRHPVTSVAFSPNGRNLVSASDDPVVKLWDVETGNEVLTFPKGHTNGITCVAFSPSGRQVASAGLDQTIRRWNVVPREDGTLTAEPLPPLEGHTKPVTCVAYSPDGKHLASADRASLEKDSQVRIWDAEHGQEVFSQEARQGSIWTVAFSPDGKRLVAAGDDGAVKTWDLAARKPVLQAAGRHGAAVRSVVYSADGQYLATASDDGSVKVWEAATGDLLLTLNGHGKVVFSVAFAADGQRLASVGLDRTVKVWAARERDVLPLRGHTGKVLGLAFHPDGRRLASAGEDKKIQLWDAVSGEVVRTFKGHTVAVAGVAFAPDGRHLASASYDRTVRLWDLDTGDEVRRFTEHKSLVSSVAFSPDGRLLASTDTDNQLIVREATIGQVAGRFASRRPLRCVAFSPDSSHVAAAGDDLIVRVWQVAGFQQAGHFQGHEGVIRSLAFSPDGKYLASACMNGLVRVWERDTGKAAFVASHLRAVHGVAFSPDGRRLASASADPVVKLWDTAIGDEVLTLKADLGEFTGVAFSADGRRLAAASADGSVKVWDLSP